MAIEYETECSFQDKSTEEIRGSMQMLRRFSAGDRENMSRRVCLDRQPRQTDSYIEHVS